MTDNGDGTVSWSDSFSFIAQNDVGGESPVVTVTLEAVDDICFTTDPEDPNYEVLARPTRWLLVVNGADGNLYVVTTATGA